jgi:hypothetical protein
MVGERVCGDVFSVGFLEGAGDMVDNAGGGVGVELYCFKSERVQGRRLENVESVLRKLA